MQKCLDVTWTIANEIQVNDFTRAQEIARSPEMIPIAHEDKSFKSAHENQFRKIETDILSLNLALYTRISSHIHVKYIHI